MSTIAQDAFAEGFAALAEIHGETWTFGAASFTGVATELQPNDPRLMGATDRMLSVLVATANLPAVRPARGNDIVRAGKHYRIAGPLASDVNTGVTTILVANQ